MRRMIDPKELGGGGDLYMHCIKIVDVSPDTTIAVNFYSKNSEKVNTIESLKKYLVGAKGVVCNGYKQVGDHYAIVNLIDTSINGDSLVAYFIDLTNGSKDKYYLSNADNIVDTPMLLK